MALGFAVASRGADHNRSGAYQVDFSEQVDRMHAGPEAVLPAIQTENEAVLMDSLIVCKFLRGVFEEPLADMAHMLSLVTGWDTSGDELEQTAQRLIHAKKWYNIQQGWTPDEDTLPRRFFSEPLPGGASQGAILGEEQLATLVRVYNTAREWTAEGWLTDEQIASWERLIGTSPTTGHNPSASSITIDD
jgi:aldehyde:ferredoxin oxidoreductase